MKTVRILYLVPKDRKFNRKYKKGIEKSIIDFQKWCSHNAEGYTFYLHKPIVEVLKTKHDAKWYINNPIDKDKMKYFIKNSLADAKSILENEEVFLNFIWIIFVDTLRENAGVKMNSIICLSENYLKGFIGLHLDEKYIPRWIGKLGREIGLAFGLKEPDETQKNALMRFGYAKYPNCYLTKENIALLKKSSFLYDDFFSSNPIYEEYNKERFLYNLGYYINTKKKKWEERKYNGKKFYYKEIFRNNEYILLKDNSRKLYVRLLINAGFSEHSSDKYTWHRDFKIEKPKPILRNVVI